MLQEILSDTDTRVFITTSFIMLSINLSLRGLGEHFALERCERRKTFTVEKLPEIAKVSRKAIKKLKTGDFSDDIKTCLDNFLRTLSKEKHIDLSRFYHNFNKDMVELVKDFKEKDQNGFYEQDLKRIFVIEEKMNSSIYHELFHSASTRAEGNIYSSGFRQVCRKESPNELFERTIGKGLNEGYTSLLTERYFIKSPISYPILKKLTECIEEIAGKEKMESMYFRGDIGGLIEELSKYAPLEDVIALLRKMDHICEAIFNSSRIIPSLFTPTKYREIVLIIAKMYKNKIKSSLEGDNVAMSNCFDVFTMINGMVDILGTGVTYRHLKFEIKDSLIQSILNDLNQELNEYGIEMVLTPTKTS